jgi:hypothetical protein
MQSATTATGSQPDWPTNFNEFAAHFLGSGKFNSPELFSFINSLQSRHNLIIPHPVENFPLLSLNINIARQFLRIPEQVGHQFRSNPATDSASFRPGIPVESGH